MGLLQPPTTPRDGIPAPSPSSPHHPLSHKHALVPRQPPSASGCWLWLCHLFRGMIEELSSARHLLPTEALTHCNQGGTSAPFDEPNRARLRNGALPGLIRLQAAPCGDAASRGEASQHPVEIIPDTPWRCCSAPQGDALDPVMLLPLPLPSGGMLLGAEGALACAAAPWHRQGGIFQLGAGSEILQPRDSAEQPDLLL